MIIIDKMDKMVYLYIMSENFKEKIKKLQKYELAHNDILFYFLDVEDDQQTKYISKFADIGTFFNYSLLEIIKYNQSLIKDELFEYGLVHVLTNLKIKNPFSGWFWTVISFDELSEETSKYFKVPTTKIDQSLIKDYLKTFCSEITPGMWANNHDPSVLMIDPTYYPYSNNQGWDYKDFSKILEKWWHFFHKKPVICKIRGNND